MDEKKIQEVMSILTKWNPLGDKASRFPDLDNYRTEACDILFHVDFENANTVSKVTTMVKDILNEAFDITLTREDCIKAGKEIYEIIKK